MLPVLELVSCTLITGSKPLIDGTLKYLVDSWCIGLLPDLFSFNNRLCLLSLPSIPHGLISQSFMRCALPKRPKHNVCFFKTSKWLFHIYHIEVWSIPEIVYRFVATHAFIYEVLTFVFCNILSDF